MATDSGYATDAEIAAELAGYAAEAHERSLALHTAALDWSHRAERNPETSIRKIMESNMRECFKASIKLLEEARKWDALALEFTGG